MYEVCLHPITRRLLKHLHILQLHGHSQKKRKDSALLKLGEENILLCLTNFIYVCLEQLHHFHKNLFYISLIQKVKKLHLTGWLQTLVTTPIQNTSHLPPQMICAIDMPYFLQAVLCQTLCKICADFISLHHNTHCAYRKLTCWSATMLLPSGLHTKTVKTKETLGM
jgi:hypothetical protein